MLSPEYLVCDLPVADRLLFLTFDDGPVPDVTPYVLDILRSFSVPATFFCVGDNTRKYPEVFNRITDEGHAVGNHTFHHLNGWKCPPAAYMEDVTRCRETVDSPLFRPPYGKITPSQYMLLRKDYRIILWSLLSADFDNRVLPEQCLSNVCDNVNPGSVIVFHDSVKARKNMEYALPRFLEHALSKKYTFSLLPPFIHNA